MLAACESALPVDVAVCCAAVADWRPECAADHKIKKSEGPAGPGLTLVANPDILAASSKAGKRPRLVIGFAAETDDLLANAQKKLQRKHVNLMVANDVRQPGAGFDADTNLVKILDAQGGVEELPLLSKRAVADRILDRVVKLLAGR